MKESIECRASQVALVIKNLPANTGDIRDLALEYRMKQGKG